MKETDIENLAKLARIELSEAEKKSLLKDLDSILSYVEQVKSISADVQHAAIIPEHKNVMREDKDPHELGIFTKRLLSEAPSSERGYIRVKKIL